MTNATQTLTIADPLTLGAGQNWNVTSGQTLTASGTLNTNGVALNIFGAGNTTLSGAVSGGGSITMSGTGTLSLTKANSYLAVRSSTRERFRCRRPHRQEPLAITSL